MKRILISILCVHFLGIFSCCSSVNNYVHVSIVAIISLFVAVLALSNDKNFCALRYLLHPLIVFSLTQMVDLRLWYDGLPKAWFPYMC